MEVVVLGARARNAVHDVPAFVRRLQRAARDRHGEAQAFDADLVFGEDHLLSAWEKAERAYRRGRNVARDRMVEALLFASGERQITAALDKMGLKPGSDTMVLLTAMEGKAEDLLDALDLERDDALVAGRLERLAAFGIGRAEIETVPEGDVFDLVLERVALVETLR